MSTLTAVRFVLDTAAALLLGGCAYYVARDGLAAFRDWRNDRKADKAEAEVAKYFGTATVWFYTPIPTDLPTPSGTDWDAELRALTGGQP